MLSKWLILIIGVTISAWAIPGLTKTGAAQFNVTVTVASGCNVRTPDPTLSFGSFVPGTGGVIKAEASFNVTCTVGTPYAVSISGGQHMKDSGSGGLVRALSDGSHTLTYNLYTDSSRSQVWQPTCSEPPGGSGSDCRYGVGDGTTNPYTVYGKIVNDQDVPPGLYVDHVTITVSY